MSTSCAGLTDSAVLPFGCALRMREHVLTGKLTVNIACGVGRLHIPSIRVRYALRRSEHAPSDKMDGSGVCKNDRLHCSANRVRNSAKRNCCCREGRKAEYSAESLYPNERNVKSVNTARTATPDWQDGKPIRTAHDADGRSFRKQMLSRNLLAVSIPG